MNQSKEELFFDSYRNDYLKFCERYFLPYLETPYIYETYYSDWAKIINSREPIDKPNRTVLRWLEEIARGHSKTMFLNTFLTIYDAVTGKYTKQVTGAATNGQTKEIADNIKRMLLRSPYLCYQFVPDSIAKLEDKNLATATINTQWNNDKIILKNGSIIYFRSMQQEWSGLHVQKATLDDVVPKKSSKLSDEEGIRTFKFDIMPTLKALNADLFIIGTPVRKGDLLDEIKKSGIFLIHKFRAISDFDNFKNIINNIYQINNISCEDSFNAKCRWLMNNQNFEFSEGKDIQEEVTELCLSKNRFGWKGYMKIYAEIGKNAFDREFLMLITENNNSIIQSVFIEKAKDKGRGTKFLESRDSSFIHNLIQVWDFSFSKSDSADKTACIMAWNDRRSPNATFYQLLWESQPKEYSNWKNTILSKMTEFNEQYKPDAIVPEVNSILQLTDDIKSLGLPIKPIWTGSSDSTLKNKILNKNFNNMISIDKSSAIERLGTVFENEQAVLVYGNEKAKEGSDTIGEQLVSWVYSSDKKGDIEESGVHPDAGICLVLANEYLKNKNSTQKIMGTFI